MNHEKIILLDHGSGGTATRDLIRGLFLKRLSNPLLTRLEDSAILIPGAQKIAFTTDSFVVDPLFFPGGDIGSLSIHGTVNDLAMKGATPIAISLGIILEEGFPIDQLERITDSISRACKCVGCQIVTGDTKVVEKGKADKIFINTSGIGVLTHEVDLSSENVLPGDVVIVSGFIGDHGAAILLSRNELPFEAEIKSDSAPLSSIVKALLDGLTPEELTGVKLLTDPTRGGVATVLNEIAQASCVQIKIYEDSIPVRDEVRGFCELLGLDPLYLANEGKFILIVSENIAKKALSIIRGHRLGKNAQKIGEISQKSQDPKVILETSIGGERIIPMLTGQPLPRIC